MFGGIEIKIYTKAYTVYKQTAKRKISYFKVQANKAADKKAC